MQAYTIMKKGGMSLARSKVVVRV